MRCQTCIELRDRIHDLERDLGLRHAADVRYAIARGLKVTPGAATIAARLYAAKGGHVDSGQLMDATAPAAGEDERDPKIVPVIIWQLRKAMGRDAIQTHYGKGYCLSPIGREKLAAIVESDRRGAAA